MPHQHENFVRDGERSSAAPSSYSRVEVYRTSRLIPHGAFLANTVHGGRHCAASRDDYPAPLLFHQPLSADDRSTVSGDH